MKKELNIMDDIFNTLIEISLQQAAKADSSYSKSTLEVEEAWELYQKLDLENNTMEIIEKYAEAVNYNGTNYGNCAYKTGFRDGILLLKELGLIG